ncbi:MAG: hypothetical protein WCZ29_10705, partial [Mycolicibacterium vanbaalenii]
MNFSSWALTVVVSPAIAAGILLVAPAVAQAAPDDTGASSSESTAASTSEETSSRSEPEQDQDRADEVDGADHTADADLEVDGDDPGAIEDDEDEHEVADASQASEGDGASEDDGPDVAEDGATSGPHYLPSSVRESSAENLVTVDTAAVVDEELEEPVDQEPVDQEPVDEDGAEPDEDEDTDTVELAIDQLADARDDLYAATWGDGNILAGLAAILPQMMLAG